MECMYLGERCVGVEPRLKGENGSGYDKDALYT